MKRILTIALLLLILFQSTPVYAQVSERDVLLLELQTLLQQLVELQARLDMREGMVLGASATRSLTKSKYYDGVYEAIYFVDGEELRPYKNTIPNATDIALFEHWKNIVGQDIVERYITEFRIYNDEDADFDAFVEQIGNSDDWIVGVNLPGSDLRDLENYILTTELFVHEFAHVLHHYQYNARESFEDSFWSPRSRKSRDYVSDYAMESVEEDFAESFTFYVLNPSEAESKIAREKVAFFDAYAEFRAVKAGIRGRLDY